MQPQQHQQHQQCPQSPQPLRTPHHYHTTWWWMCQGSRLKLRRAAEAQDTSGAPGTCFFLLFIFFVLIVYSVATSPPHHHIMTAKGAWDASWAPGFFMPKKHYHDVSQGPHCPLWRQQQSLRRVLSPSCTAVTTQLTTTTVLKTWHVSSSR